MGDVIMVLQVELEVTLIFGTQEDTVKAKSCHIGKCFTSVKEVNSLSSVVCLSVCLLARLRKKQAVHSWHWSMV